MAKVVHVLLSLEPKHVVTVQCDEMIIGENDEVQVYYEGELWGYFPEAVASYLEEVDEDEDEDDDEDDDLLWVAEDDDDDDDDNGGGGGGGGGGGPTAPTGPVLGVPAAPTQGAPVPLTVPSASVAGDELLPSASPADSSEEPALS